MMAEIDSVEGSRPDATSLPIPAQPIKDGDPAESDLDSCPCERHIGASWKLKCMTCLQYWHTWCVGLKYLDDNHIKLLKEWNCPLCYVLPQSVIQKTGIIDIGHNRQQVKGNQNGNASQNCSGLRTFIKDELANIVPQIAASVVKAQAVDTKAVANEVGKIIEGSQIKQLVEKANVEITKSWASIAVENQEALIEKVVEKSSKTALSKSMQLIDANMTEARNRSRNIVIYGLVENDHENETEEDLKSTTFQILEGRVNKDEILSAKRLGRFDPQKKKRVVLVSLKYEDDAFWAHNQGKGYKARNFTNVYVNPDRTRAERDALREKLIAKKAQKESSGKSVTNTVESEKNSTDNQADSDISKNGPENGQQAA